MWRINRYLLTFVAGQVAGIVAAGRKDRVEFIASVKQTIHRLTEPTE